MNKNPALIAFITISFVVFLWFFSIAAYRTYGYYALSEETKPLNLNWFVEEISSDDFRVGAAYTYLDGLSGETLFSDRKFRNPSSADDELKVKASKNYVVHYDPQNIYHSSLQKTFPTKECVSAGVLFLLSLYFVGLGMYAQNKKI